MEEKPKWTRWPRAKKHPVKKEGYLWVTRDIPPITTKLIEIMLVAYKKTRQITPLSDMTGIHPTNIKKAFEIIERGIFEKYPPSRGGTVIKRQVLSSIEEDYVRRVYLEKSIPIRTLSKMLGISHPHFEYLLWKMGIWRRERRRTYIEKEDPPRHWPKWKQEEYRIYHEVIKLAKEMKDKQEN